MEASPSLRGTIRHAHGRRQTSERAADSMQDRYPASSPSSSMAERGAGLTEAVHDSRRSTTSGPHHLLCEPALCRKYLRPQAAEIIGDIQEKITAISSKLLFFPLELDRINDAGLEAAISESQRCPCRSSLEDLRPENPYKLDDELGRLFHEKAVRRRRAPRTASSTKR